MNINFFNANFINTIKNNKINVFTSNPIKFRGLDRDCFEKSIQNPNTSYQIEELSALFEKDEDIKELKTRLSQQPKGSKDAQSIEEDIKEAQKERGDYYVKLNPNAAFLHDNTLSWVDKKKILENHPEILMLIQINDKTVENPNYSIILNNSPYFIKDRAGNGNFVDLSFQPNKENLDELLKEGVLSIKQICSQYNFNPKELQRYINTYSIEPIRLTNWKTGEKEYISGVYDTNTDEFQQALNRKNQIAQKFPKASAYINQNYVSAQYLSKLKLGSEEELFQDVLQKNLCGVIKEIETEEGKKEVAFVDITNAMNLTKLQYKRNQNPNIIDINQLCAKAKIGIEDFEDALIEGEIEAIPVYIIKNDKNKLLFNIKNPKNAKFIRQKQLESEISAIQTKIAKKKQASFRMSLVWSLCPNTRHAASIAAAQTPGIIRIFEKLEEIKEYRQLSDEEKFDKEEPVLSKEEKIYYKSYYKNLWKQAGTQELNDAHKRVSQALKEFKSSGIEGISDDEIRQYFINNYKPNLNL